MTDAQEKLVDTVCEQLRLKKEEAIADARRQCNELVDRTTQEVNDLVATGAKVVARELDSVVKAKRAMVRDFYRLFVVELAILAAIVAAILCNHYHWF